MATNGEGSVRQLTDGTWECIIQSKYLNPKTNKPKRIKRKGKTEKEAIKKTKMALLAWEKSFEDGRNTSTDRKKTFGQYMEEFIDNEVKPYVSGSTYKSYIYTMNATFYNYKISKLQLHLLNTVEFEIYFDAIIHEKSAKNALYAKSKRERRDEYFRKSGIEERKEFFTNEDIVKFYNSYKNNVSEYSAAIVLMLETMMRGQELLPLSIDDIDFEKILSQ